MERFKTASPRFFALIIDGLVFVLFIYFESFFLIPEMPVPIVFTGLIIHYFCAHFYNIYLHAVYGQTLGKMALKIKVLDVSESPVSFRQAILRESPGIMFSIIFLGSEMYQVLTAGITDDFRYSFFDQMVLGVLLLWVIAEVVVMLGNEKRRSIHDLIAGTVVVRQQ